MLLKIIKLQHNISFFEHFGQDLLKENFIAYSQEKLSSMTKEQQTIFLIQEFEKMLSKINCPVEYLMDLVVNDIMHDDSVVEKVQCRKNKNIPMTYRGLIFPLERRFETFMTVILFKQIIQDNAAENLSEDILLFLIRARMALTITKAWRAFVRDRV